MESKEKRVSRVRYSSVWFRLMQFMGRKKIPAENVDGRFRSSAKLAESPKTKRQIGEKAIRNVGMVSDEKNRTPAFRNGVPTKNMNRRGTIDPTSWLQPPFQYFQRLYFDLSRPNFSKLLIFIKLTLYKLNSLSYLSVSNFSNFLKNG